MSSLSRITFFEYLELQVVDGLGAVEQLVDGYAQGQRGVFVGLALENEVLSAAGHQDLLLVALDEQDLP